MTNPKIPILFKTLGLNNEPVHGGTGTYATGEWLPPVEPVPCRSGYHLSEAQFLLEWIAPRIFEVEVRGEAIASNLKWTVEQVKLVKELPFDPESWVEWCMARLPKMAGRSLSDHNRSNEQTDLFCALAVDAAAGPVDAAVQVVPKRVAQAQGFAAFDKLMWQRWDAVGGRAQTAYWLESEQLAAAAKNAAHYHEREEQTGELLRRLGIVKS